MVKRANFEFLLNVSFTGCQIDLILVGLACSTLSTYNYNGLFLPVFSIELKWFLGFKSPFRIDCTM